MKSLNCVISLFFRCGSRKAVRALKLKQVGIIVAIFLALFSVGCSNSGAATNADPEVSTDTATDAGTSETAPEKSFGIFTVSEDGQSAEVRGVIVDASLIDFNNMIAKYPNIKTLNLVDAPGADVSDIDGDKTDACLEIGRKVYNLGINTHLVDNGMAASGGTDLLVSGKSVTVGANVTVGVHSWGGGVDGEEGGSAWDIKDDENRPEHQKYIRYYQDVGFSAQKAKEFYFFTIRAAKEDDIHNMTAEEIKQYLLR